MAETTERWLTLRVVLVSTVVALAAAVIVFQVLGGGDEDDGGQAAPDPNTELGLIPADDPVPTDELAAVTYQDLGGVTSSMGDLRGKPVVLNFFGSWCAPCLRELPDFQAVSERYEGEIVFVGIAVEDTRKGAADILQKTGVTYPAAFDSDSDTLIDYAIRGMPTTVFISADGKLLERAERALSESQLEAIIERLFAIS